MEQYDTPGLFENILERLRQQGIDVSRVTSENISGVDEFHVRGAEVSIELAGEVKSENSKVLDVGSGIGGPARMLASPFACNPAHNLFRPTLLIYPLKKAPLMSSGLSM